MKKNLKEETKKNLERKARKERVDSITKIVEGIKYASQNDREEAIFSYCKSALTVQEIEKLTENLKQGYDYSTSGNDFKNKPRAGVY